ncbi:hypothetical protein WG628_20260 [Stenotrophomonas maltophilia]
MRSLEEFGLINLLEDWCSFCEGVAVFDKSHFLGLLKEHSSSDELNVIFSHFPFSDILASRAAQVIASGTVEGSFYLLPASFASRDELVRLGGEWLSAQALICGEIDDVEISEICAGASVRFVSADDLDSALRQDIPQHWIFDEVGDALRASRMSDSDQMYALLEALYGLAADYYLAWYIAGPLFKIDVDLEPYFRFWSAGGRCALTRKELMVSSRAASLN